MRPPKDEYFMMMATLAGTRSTCLRRKVGCVLVNERGHVLATGYNGVAAGLPHCNEPDPFSTNFPHACEGASSPSGTDLDRCEAIHAEQNALLQCRNPWEIKTAYCTTFPCITCIKLLLNTSCQLIVYGEAYSHPEAARLWERAGRATSLLNIGGIK